MNLVCARPLGARRSRALLVLTYKSVAPHHNRRRAQPLRWWRAAAATAPCTWLDCRSLMSRCVLLKLELVRFFHVFQFLTDWYFINSDIGKIYHRSTSYERDDDVFLARRQETVLRRRRRHGPDDRVGLWWGRDNWCFIKLLYKNYFPTFSIHG